MPEQQQISLPRKSFISDPQTDLTLTVEMVKMSPEMAQSILDKTAIDQRKINNNTVYLYSDQMKKGLWIGANGESIKVSSDGNMIDGQHRLKAVVHSQCTVDMLLIKGIHEDNITTIDDGKPRSFADILSMDGLDGTELAFNTISTFCRHVFRLKKAVGKDGIFGTGHFTTKLSNTELLKFLKSNESLMVTANDYSNNFKVNSISKIVGRPSPMIFWHIFRGTKYRGAAYSILKTIESGYPANGELLDKSASFCLYNKISNMKMIDSKKRFRFLEIINMLLWALDRESSGKETVNFKVALISGRDMSDSPFFKEIYYKLSSLK